MFCTPALVEATDICGPLSLTLYASTTDNEVLWFVQLLEVDPQGTERLLTRGWLRGSQRRIDPKRSKPWAPYHFHDKREPLSANEIYEFNIEIRPTVSAFVPDFASPSASPGTTAARRHIICTASARAMWRANRVRA